MKTIWKFELKTVDKQIVEMPLDTKILTIQVQNNNPCLWCLVNPEKEKVCIEIRIIGTGHPIEDDFTGKYIGTYKIYKGAGIFHVFDDGYY